MHVFVTGATGWIGSAVVDDLLDAGHEVTGLARSEVSAAALERKGARIRRGDLDDLDGLRAGAEEAEAVIHLANKHDWGNPAETNRAERSAVQAFADALTGTGRAFVLAAGLSTLAKGRPATESDLSPAIGPGSHRGGSENLALEYAEKGMRVISVRFAPSVHGVGDHGFVSAIVAAARKHGVSGYLGDGTASWAAVHHTDAARLVRLGLEGAPTGSLLHAVAEEAVTTREIAEAVGRMLDVPMVSVAPEKAGEHFGFVGRFFALDMSASSDRTRELLKWTPYGPSLAEDIEASAYA
ncbi:3-beta hydroxysteroid dehydrogenase [Amycolatopsis sp. WAC 01375]|uniref:SDR family oxidoreductase n=1 Tax=Amycolatopsis sp. WAC 01375 TaxID=2203194 RepID=UPI000F7B099B|nr:SDR family oxidoreductase [Amycolatopsis sp. WAC 01375]RSM79586.1 3-beta hydroxysteroid dehydrogenase [Amycolatopsis sp. WAC 01375]